MMSENVPISRIIPLPRPAHPQRYDRNFPGQIERRGAQSFKAFLVCCHCAKQFYACREVPLFGSCFSSLSIALWPPQMDPCGKALPAVFSLCMMMWNKVRQKTKKSVDQGVLKTQQMFQYFQKLAQVFIQPVVRLAFEFRRAIRRFFDRGSQFFKGINEKIKLGLLIPGKKIAKGMERIQKKFVQMKEKLKQQTAQLADRLQDGIQWIRQTPLTFLSWGQFQFQRLKSQGATKSAPMVKRWRSSQQNAQKSAEWVSRQVKRGADAIKRTFEPLAVFYRQFYPVFRKIRGSIQGKWKRARDFFGQKHQQSLNYLEKKQQRLKELSAQHLIHRIISQMWLPNRLKGVEKWLSHPLVKEVFEAAVRLYALIAGACLSAFSLLLQGISAVSSHSWPERWVPMRKF